MSDGSEINAGKPAANTGSEDEKPVVTIAGYQAVRSADYGTTITFHASADFIPGGYKIHWYINGEDMGTGEDYTVENAAADFTVSARLMKDGSSISESKTEKVDVNTSFFGRLIAFFKKLFNSAAFIIDQK